jgi:hypothetical protein
VVSPAGGRTCVVSEIVEILSIVLTAWVVVA